MNTRTPAARLVLALATITLVPLGFRVMAAALAEPSPHLMVMLIFSGSLTTLIGLATGVGFVTSLRPESQSEEAPSSQENDRC